MPRPPRDAEAIYDEHIAPLPDETKIRLAQLIHARIGRKEASAEVKLAEFDGLGREVWEGVDPDSYVRALRDEWQRRP